MSNDLQADDQRQLPKNYKPFESTDISCVRDFLNDFVLCFSTHCANIPLAFVKEGIPSSIIEKIFQRDNIYLDNIRLEKAIVAAFDDIKRCADFHNLFAENKDGTEQQICIEEAKKAGFFTRWFMIYTPIVVKPETIGEMDDYIKFLYDQFGNGEDQSSALGKIKLAYRLRDLLAKYNEEFILDWVFLIVMSTKFGLNRLLAGTEIYELIYMMTYRSGRLHSEDLSQFFKLFHDLMKTRDYMAAVLDQDIREISRRRDRLNEIQSGSPIKIPDFDFDLVVEENLHSS